MALSTFTKWFLSWRKYLTWRVIVTFLLGYVCLRVFSELQEAIAGTSWIVRFDQLLANELHARATTTSTDVFKWISVLGFEVVWLLIIGVAHRVGKCYDNRSNCFLLGEILCALEPS